MTLFPPLPSSSARPAYDRARCGGRPPRLARSRVQSAFTLIELLVVIGIMLLLMVMLAPAFNAIKGGGDITSAAYDVAGALQTARAYAIANNTYTWVGFFEYDPALTTAPDDIPPYDKAGRVVIAIVSSKDGTMILRDSDAAAELPAGSLSAVVKPTIINNVHLTDVAAPSPSPNATPDPSSLDGRPATPYTYGKNDNEDHYNRISSDSDDKTNFPFKVNKYKFYKTVRFGPTGKAEVLVNKGTYYQHETRQIFEIGIRPTHGSVVDTKTSNVVAVQLTGIGGNVKIYRR